MSVEQIRKLRSERIELINRYMQEIEQVKADDRISESYRQEKLKELNKKLEEVRDGHDRQIKELIESGKAECKRKIEEFEGANEKELMKLLLIETRNRAIEERALIEYADNANDLYNKIVSEVESKSNTAQAYINAFMKIEGSSGQLIMLRHKVKELERQHKENMFNDMQRAYANELKRYEKQEAEYKEEIEADAFTRNLMQYS